MTDKGQEYLNKALAIKGDEGQDKMQKGRIYALQGDYDNAVSNLSAAIEAGVNKANFYLDRSTARWETRIHHLHIFRHT